MATDHRHTHPHVHLLVACSATKAAPAPPALTAGPHTSAARWLAELDAAATTTTARHLYRGQHAAATRQPHPEHVNVQIISAGWGLIGLDTPIAAYDATFTADTPTRVPGNPRTWWAHLTARSGRIAELDSTVIAALAPAYLDAIADDLADHPDHHIVTTGPKRAGQLTAPAAAVHRHLGGGCTSANARLGHHVAARHANGWTIDQIAAELASWTDGHTR